jgi:hypothetical protein
MLRRFLQLQLTYFIRVPAPAYHSQINYERVNNAFFGFCHGLGKLKLRDIPSLGTLQNMQQKACIGIYQYSNTYLSYYY